MSFSSSVPTVLYSENGVADCNKETKLMHGIYAHGKLLTLLGHDYIHRIVDGKHFIEDGIYPITLRHSDGIDYAAKLYYWNSDNGLEHGLVVFGRDKEASDYAMNCINIKASKI